MPKICFVLLLALLANFARGEDYVITDPMEFLHSGPESMVEMYGKAAKIRTLDDGLTTVAEWYLGHRVIVAEFDAFGICVSYGIYRYITASEKAEMIEPIEWGNGQTSEFERTNSLNIFSDKKKYRNGLGFTAVITDTSAVVSIDPSTNELYKAQVQDKRSKL